GLKRLLQMPLAAALGFYAFLFVPLAASLGESLLTPDKVGVAPIIEGSLFFWNLSVVVPLAILLFLTARVNIGARRMWINGIILIAFFAALLIASFLVPDLYPYYVNWYV
ncbi:MAG: hypothetical protein ACRECH_18605, partial [Nitrososphaerales archaeon]